LLCPMLGPERREAVLPGRGVVLTDLQSSIVKNLLSLSLSLSLLRRVYMLEDSITSTFFVYDEQIVFS